MGVFDALRQMDEELWEEETEEEEMEAEEEVFLRPRIRQGPRLRQAVYADEESMDDREAVFIEEKRKGRGNGGLKFLIFLELLGILAVIWWWIKWLY